MVIRLLGNSCPLSRSFSYWLTEWSAGAPHVDLYVRCYCGNIIPHLSCQHHTAGGASHAAGPAVNWAGGKPPCTPKNSEVEHALMR